MIQKMEGDVYVAHVQRNLTKERNDNPKNADAQGALGALCHKRVT